MPYLLALTGINKRGSILHPLVNRGCRLPSLACSRYTGYAYAALDMMKCTTKLTGEPVNSPLNNTLKGFPEVPY